MSFIFSRLSEKMSKAIIQRFRYKFFYQKIITRWRMSYLLSSIVFFYYFFSFSFFLQKKCSITFWKRSKRNRLLRPKKPKTEQTSFKHFQRRKNLEKRRRRRKNWTQNKETNEIFIFKVLFVSNFSSISTKTNFKIKNLKVAI